jgi:hypothetical protein
MIQPVAAAAILAVVGGVVAIAARDARVLSLGLAVAMVAAAFAASPQPTALAVSFRILGSLLAGYLLVVAARSRSIESQGSGLGLVAESALAAGAFTIGWFIVPVTPMHGPVAAQAGGVALVAAAVVPLAGRDVLRAGAGAALLVVGGSMLIQAWAAPLSSVAQVVTTALLVLVAGAASLLISPADAVVDVPAASPEAAERAREAVSSPPTELVAPGEEVAATSAEDEGQTEDAAPEASSTAPDARRGSGSVSRNVVPAVAEPPEDIPDPKEQRRPSTIRSAPFGPLRGEGRLDESPAATPAPTAPEETGEAAPASPDTAPDAIAGPAKARRLRSREPRR